MQVSPKQVALSTREFCDATPRQASASQWINPDFGLTMIDRAPLANSPLSVLIVDDNPAHLQIYAWIVESAGYTAMPAPVDFEGVQLPEKPSNVVLLDYHLGGQITAVEVAKMILLKHPNIPLIILSDLYELPADIAPYAAVFVRKGNPEKLVALLHDVLRPCP
jgi:CheY-like chemotaxis protein